MSLERVTAVCVLHNSAAVVEDMLRSLPDKLAVIVVDNCSTDDGATIVARTRPSANIIRSTENGGYGRGMNQALAAVDTPFALIVNPDTSFSAGAVEALLATADRFPGTALIGPRICNPDGSVEISHDVPLDRRKAMGRRNREPAPEGPICTEFLSGAVWFARMDAVRAVGAFDPNIFLFYEDDDLCRRLRDSGHVLMVEPSATVTHIGGGSAPGTTTYSRLRYWHMAWSRLYFERKHLGTAAMWRVFWREAPVYFLKAVGYGLIFNRGKARRDFARACGMLAAVRGRPAQ